MSMPKGYKSETGYATVTSDYGGMDYRAIADKMSEDGFKMNHATARNVFLRAMKKLAAPVCQLHDVSDDADVDRTSRDPRFQEGMVEIISDIYDNKIEI